MLNRISPDHNQAEVAVASGGLLIGVRKLKAVEQFVKVPTKLLGMLLDHGKPSAYAAHMLAIKINDQASAPVLNETRLRDRYGISQRAFRQGVRLMKSAKVLERKQSGRRTFADERLAEAGRGFLKFPSRLLKEDSFVVAGVLAVNLNPDPSRPQEIAARLGIKSRPTAEKLSKSLIATGAVAHHIGTRGTVWLARSGYEFDLIKNDPTKNDPTKNVSTHSRRKKALQKEEDTSEENHLSHDTRSSERGPHDDDFLRDRATKMDLGPEFQVLSDWKTTRYIAERGLYFTGKPKETMTLEGWRQWLEYFGGAPGHLATPQAFMQAVEIASELDKTSGKEITQHVATVGLAFAICRAHAAGKRIKSLAFIAERLLRLTEDGDLSWCYGWPSSLPHHEMCEVHEFATNAANLLESQEVNIDRRQLFSTMRLEALAVMLRKYGHDVAMAGIRRGAQYHRPAEGQQVCGWNWFEPDVLDALDAINKGIARQRMQQARKRRR